MQERESLKLLIESAAKERAAIAIACLINDTTLRSIELERRFSDGSRAGDSMVDAAYKSVVETAGFQLLSSVRACRHGFELVVCVVRESWLAPIERARVDGWATLR